MMERLRNLALASTRNSEAGGLGLDGRIFENLGGDEP
jgi:hypothetical protein